MKFFAILKDSLREAIDTKVFYVMVALSLLLALLALSFGFKPTPAGQQMMQVAVMSLGLDMQELTPEEFERIGQAAMMEKMERYQLVSAEPLNGGEDGPNSSFHVLLRIHCANATEAAEIRSTPAQTTKLIADRFGILSTMRMFNLSEVQPAAANVPGVPAKPDVRDVYYELVAKPTSVTLRLWPHKFSLFFGAWPWGDSGLPLGREMFLIERYLVNGIGAWIAILVSVVITAFFIPNMLRKGTVDLLLVKPIHRTTLLLYKFVGGLTFIYLNTTVAVVGVWLALSLRSGVWAYGLLLTVFVITFFFMILYAVSTLFGVLTRSPIASILMTCGVWFLLFIVGSGFDWFEGRRKIEEKQNVPASERYGDNWLAKTVFAVHFILPRTSDLDNLTSQLLLQDLLTNNQVEFAKINKSPISWGESLTVSGVFIAVMLGLSCMFFAMRDY
jgi:ABC-type transport system involved in multi-copper enzyme maturation permease subunit